MGSGAVMDAVELPLPPSVVAVSKLMGSEGLGGGGGLALEEVGVRRLENASVLVRASVNACGSSVGPKEISAASSAEPAGWNRRPDAEHWRPVDNASSFSCEDASEDHSFSSANTAPSLASVPEAKQLHRKSTKVGRTSGTISKRSRTVQIEVPTNNNAEVDVLVNSTDLSSSPAKCNFAEKSQVPKQKSNSNGKRGEKRTNKGPKNNFSLKNGFVSFGSAAGGNNLLGAYGLKPDVFDITKYLEDMSVNELLDGTYRCPHFAKDKGKKAINSNENLLLSIRNASSVFRGQKPLEAQSCSETDNHSNAKVPTNNLLTGPAAVRSDDVKGNTSPTNMSFCEKETCCKLELPSTMDDYSLQQPKDILELLALPPSKDLDSLLLDAAKPTTSSKNSTDLRIGKPASYRNGLPPFPWSHAYSGHNKSGPDSVKLPTSKVMCQGRWVRVGNDLSPVKGFTGFHMDLESLTYDHTLVPLDVKESGHLREEKAVSLCISLSSYSRIPSAAASLASQDPPAEHSPRLLAAAQTLCELANFSLKQNPKRVMTWLQKPSLKAKKACKLKSNDKSEKQFAAIKPALVSNNLANVADSMFPPKKLKFSVDLQQNDGIGYMECNGRGPLNWSAPRSSRSSPNKLVRDSFVEPRSYASNIADKIGKMPPPTRAMDKACSSQQKPRKVVTMEWNRADTKVD